MKDNGGPAFPRPELKETVPYGSSVSVYELAAAKDGMSLRDYFASKVLQTLCSYREAPDLEDGETYPEAVAKWAYIYADAMLKARQQ